MKISIKIVRTFLVLIPFILIKSALAACGFAPGGALQQVMTVTIPLIGGNITVGGEHAQGVSDVYSQYYRPAFPAPTITCSSAGQFYIESQLASTPLPLSPWNTGSSAGIVYQSGVPGLGVMLYMNRRSQGYPDASEKFPSTVAIDTCTSTTSCTVATASAKQGSFAFAMIIVHTGPISPGVIRGSDLPCTVHKVGLAGDTVEVLRTCFSGVLNIVSQTCTTPNVDVQMGSFDVNRTFSGVGTATAWRDASIKLTNCPRFYGRVSSGVGTFYSDNGTSAIGTQVKNSITLLLTSNTGVLDSTNGIIGLKSGAGSASGVGLQLASGKVGDASPTLINLALSRQTVLENTTETTLSLPLLARYIQTASTVKPGRADALVTFTINYY